MISLDPGRPVSLEVGRADVVSCGSMEVKYVDVVKFIGVEVGNGERAGIRFADSDWVAFDMKCTVADECE